MERKAVRLSLGDFPLEIRGVLEGARVFDSSCSKEARVYYIDGAPGREPGREPGLFLKIAARGGLETEACMTGFFCGLGLGAAVRAYVKADRDYLLTERIAGEDGTHPEYLGAPERLCEVFARSLAALHGRDASQCPVVSKAANLVPDPGGRYSVLTHGDYCLPNILLVDFEFAGFVDLDCAGIGDLHRDINSALWSLEYNLKTAAYNDYFLDCYGRDKIDEERLALWKAA